MATRRNWDRVRRENLVRRRGTEPVSEPQPDVDPQVRPSSASKPASERRQTLEQQCRQALQQQRRQSREQEQQRRQALKQQRREALKQQLEARKTNKPKPQAKPQECPWCGELVPASNLAAHLRTEHRGKQARFASRKVKTRRS